MGLQEAYTGKSRQTGRRLRASKGAAAGCSIRAGIMGCHFLKFVAEWGTKCAGKTDVEE